MKLDERNKARVEDKIRFMDFMIANHTAEIAEKSATVDAPLYWWGDDDNAVLLNYLVELWKYQRLRTIAFCEACIVECQEVKEKLQEQLKE